MPSTLVEHSLQTRLRHTTQTPIASRCKWFSQTAIGVLIALFVPRAPDLPRARRACAPAGREALPKRAAWGTQLPVSEVLIVKTGTTVASVAARRRDFEHWIAAGMGLPEAQVDVRRVYEGDALPAPRSVRAVVVTGSSAMVT